MSSAEGEFVVLQHILVCKVCITPSAFRSPSLNQAHAVVCGAWSSVAPGIPVLSAVSLGIGLSVVSCTCCFSIVLGFSFGLTRFVKGRPYLVTAGFIGTR